MVLGKTAFKKRKTHTRIHPLIKNDLRPVI